jgi:PAS domain S-box-containing protein
MEGEQLGWGNFTGQTYDEYQGYGWSQAVHPEDAQPTIDAWTQAVAEARTFVFEHRVRRRDGEWRLCSIRAVPVLSAEGQIREWVGVHTDITEQRRAEQQLRDLAADLSEADRHKDEFLATLAHELRNPLAPVRSSLEVLQQADGDPVLIEQVRSTMVRQIGQMVRLIDDLLDVSRITRDKLELRKERVELASIVHEAVEACRPAVEQARHELTVSLPPRPVHLHADPVRLAQVINNLLHNACKYSEPGGRISLTAERQGSYVVLSVKDTGVGIPPEMLPKIFEMFTQVDQSLERSQGGLGIGLTLVQRLVEMHEGSVRAFSGGPGRGSEFVVRLPLLNEKREQAPPEPSVSKSTPISARRILIVDDNRDAAATLAMLFKLTGNKTQMAYDGLEAVEAAAEFRPDVVLLDIGLPKLNGYEAARRIREQPWGKSVALVALTGWGQDEDRRKSSEAGFDSHIVKPVDHAALTKVLAELLAR